MAAKPLNLKAIKALIDACEGAVVPTERDYERVVREGHVDAEDLLVRLPSGHVDALPPETPFPLFFFVDDYDYLPPRMKVMLIPRLATTLLLQLQGVERDFETSWGIFQPLAEAVLTGVASGLLPPGHLFLLRPISVLILRDFDRRKIDLSYSNAWDLYMFKNLERATKGRVVRDSAKRQT